MIICEICKKAFEPASNNTKYCSSKCKSEASKNRMKNRRQKNSAPKEPTRKLCNRKDCLYFNPVQSPINHCDYNYLTGLLKGSQNGEECTKYKHSTPAKRKKFRDSVLGMITKVGINEFD
ncbi:MAG: hypothetical protein U0O22_01360 [Acutalibacteraceae bacterium]